MYVDKQEQLEELTVNIDKITPEYLNGLEIDLLFIEKKIQFGKEPELLTKSKRTPLSHWRREILDNYDSSNIRFLESSNDITGRLVSISDDKLGDLYMMDMDKKEVIPAKTFMRFQLSPPPIGIINPTNTNVNLPKIRSSFKHELTLAGKSALERVKKNLLTGFKNWSTKKVYFAPLISLCQSSGSGKTKISVECLKQTPGFYLVFRKNASTGYPMTNSLSTELKSIIISYRDSSKNLTNLNYSQCTVGSILDFFARITTSYIQSIVSKSKMIMESSKMTEAAAVQRAIHEFAKLFEENEHLELEFTVIDHGKMQNIYENFKKEGIESESESEVDNSKIMAKDTFTVGYVSSFINNAIKAPRLCLTDQSDSLSLSICNIIASKLRSFPFLFILDEADLLSDFTFQQSDINRVITGFEVLRRALGYLDQDTRIMFMTLGTKSDILDLNPPVVDMSARFTDRNSLLDLITLNSNINIFSSEYPISKIELSYKILQNPLMFKFISTLGHGLWASFPFSTVVESARMKLKNGSAATKSYFLPVWMIRTGIAAQPLHIETKTLIASHMATLFDIRNDLQSMTVSYPSEPVLAMSTRSLIDESEDNSLFEVLKRKTEAVAIDIGRFGEIFAAMIVLRAIDCAPNHAYPINIDSYRERLAEIDKLAPNFRSLWHKKTHLLEPEKCSDSTDKITEFPDYKICTVGDFLNSLVKYSGINLKEKLPKKILDGIVNASHFVHLTRDNKGFSTVADDIKFQPCNLPSADPRIKDHSRNVIDSALLKSGLLRQCGYFLPARYYGLDFILPVCLENNQVTFIGIQVKRSDANTNEDIFKMQSRLHFVNCLDCEGNDSFSFDKKQCSKCSYDRESLKNIYYNSVSILISLDEGEDFVPFSSNTELNINSANIIESSKDEIRLRRALKQNSASIKHLYGNSTSFFKPLIQETEKMDDGIALIKSIWIDKYVKLESEVEKRKVKHFTDDGFVHRQFCIATRGWKIFKHLFNGSEKGLQIANDIMASEGLFKNCSSRSDPRIIRNILYDTSPSYFQYSDELWSIRGRSDEDSNLRKLDRFEFGKGEGKGPFVYKTLMKNQPKSRQSKATRTPFTASEHDLKDEKDDQEVTEEEEDDLIGNHLPPSHWKDD